jgi:zinc protease
MSRFLSFFIAVYFIFTTAQATEVKEVVSPKGFTAWLVEEHALPLIAVKIAFKESGYAHDADGKEGRANMTAALLMEGAGDMDSRKFNEALESRAIALDMSADEDDFLVSLEALSEHKDKAFFYLGTALTKPRFDADAIERVRKQTQSAIIQQEQDPGFQLHRAWHQMAFGTHPYAKPEIGNKESVGKLGKDDLRYAASHYLTKENIIIAVVGDITPDELKKLLDTYLADLPARFEPDVTVKDVTVAASGNPVTIDFNIPQTMVAFGTGGVKRSDSDYFAAYVMNQVLGGGGSLTSRLGNEIREKRGLAYSVGTGVSPMTHSATWQGGFATRNEQAFAAKDVLISTLKDFVKNGPTDAEVSDAKQYITGSFVLNLDSNADIASFLLSMQLNHLGMDYLDKRNKMVEAVKRDDVFKMAKRLVDPDKLLIAMVGRPTPAAAK